MNDCLLVSVSNKVNIVKKNTWAQGAFQQMNDCLWIPVANKMKKKKEREKNKQQHQLNIQTSYFQYEIN